MSPSFRQSAFVAGVALVVLFVFGQATAHAVPITYTYTGTASGSVGDITLTDASFIIRYSADTDNLFSGNQLFGENALTGDKTNKELPAFEWGDVSGVFTQPDNGFYLIGVGSDGTNTTLFSGNVGDSAGYTMFAITDPAFTDYDLTSPFSFSGATPDVSPDAVFATNRGDFRFAFASAPRNVGFNAVGGIVVPEANAGLLFTLAAPALGTIVLARCKRTA